MLRLEGLRADSASFLALDHVTLAVAAGELVVVEGDEGQSRTALCEIAACLRRPDSGSVAIADRNVLALQGTSLPFVRRNIGFFSARVPFVPEDTALQNVVLALVVRGVALRPARAQAQDLLEILGVAAHCNRRMNDVAVEDERLVLLARAMVGSPPVVVLDDPTAGLGASARERVAQLIEMSREAGSAVLCVTPDASWASQLEMTGARRLSLQRGRILGGAPHISLVSADPSAGSLEGAG